MKLKFSKSLWFYYAKACLRCRGCAQIEAQNICPAFDYYRFFSYSAGGKAHIIVSIEEGLTKFKQETVDIFFKCLLCGTCSICPIGLETISMIKDVRAEAVRRKLYKPLVKPNNPPFPHSRSWGLKDALLEKCEIAIFIGCVAHVAEEYTRGFLKALQGDVGVIDRICCGGLHASLGVDFDNLRFQEALENANAERIVFLCPDCLQMAQEVGSTKELLYSSEVIDVEIGDGWSLHTPCHGAEDAKRTSVEVVGMSSNGFACGGRLVQPDEKLAEHATRKVVKQGKAKGIIVASPTCYLRLKGKVKVKPLHEFNRRER